MVEVPVLVEVMSSNILYSMRSDDSTYFLYRGDRYKSLRTRIRTS